MGYSILIPALNPDEKLIILINDLLLEDVDQIIVVNDGSKDSNIFEKVKFKNKVTVLQHAFNLGKGRALKTGLNYYLLNQPIGSVGIVTTDADGQHLVADIVSVGKKLCDMNCFILGSRSFNDKVPFRSRFGNTVTKFIFKLIVGGNITDTQSGLRGIPAYLIPKLITLSGEKYEYEFNMLIQCSNNKIKILEEPISTVYIDNNSSSHFNPLLDSMRIYFMLIRFLSSSAVTFFIDLGCFYFAYSILKNILVAFLFGRIAAIAFNFWVNKTLVFKSKQGFYSELVKYLLLVVFIGIFSYFGTVYLVEFGGVNIFLAKIVVESSLFLVSFTLQRDFIFLKQSVYEEGDS